MGMVTFMKKKIRFFILVVLWNLAASYAHPVTPTFFKQLHLSDAMFGYAFAAMAFGMFLSSPFWGQMTRVINSKSALAIGGIGYGLCQLLFSLSHSSWLILIARLLAGLSCGAFFVGSLTYIANQANESSRGSLLTLNATLQTISDALGYFIGGMLGELGIQLSFRAQIMQLIITGILFYLLLDRDVETSATFKEVAKASNPFKAFLSAKEFMSVSFAILFGMTTCVFLGYTCLDQSFNYYLKDVFAFTSKYNGTFKGIVGLVTLILNMSVGLYLLKHTNIRRANMALLALAELSVISLLFVNNALALMTMVIVFDGLYALCVPIEQNLITNRSEPKTRNLVLGFYQSTKSLGMILGALFAGMLYPLYKKGPFLLSMLAVLGALILSIVYTRRRKYE